MDPQAPTVQTPGLSGDFCWESQTSPEQQKIDRLWMERALLLAKNGEGFVEPNPMVGCVLVHGEKLVGEGWHGKFGGNHAEINALQSAGALSRGATAYVTLEPCCHRGKTGPCTEALIDAGVSRVVAGCSDPFPEVAGQGLARLKSKGIQVAEGCLRNQAIRLIAPYLCLLRLKRPWLIAKWAMTLDGKIASHSGQSQWISCEKSRALVHHWRGMVDAILVGSGTALSDNPLLTARPPGPRTPARILVDRRGRLPLETKLVQTAKDIPLVIFTTPASDPGWQTSLIQAGVEVFPLDSCGENHSSWLSQILMELGKRRFTNILVEGGGELLGSLFDQGLVDECRVFISPTILGGRNAVAPVAGQGFPAPWAGWNDSNPEMELLGRDVLIRSFRQPTSQPVDNSKSQG